MTDAQFMGMLITAIITLLGGISVIVAIIIRPVIKLNSTIAELNTKLTNLDKNYEDLKQRVNNHGKQIDRHETRISQIVGSCRK